MPLLQTICTRVLVSSPVSTAAEAHEGAALSSPEDEAGTEKGDERSGTGGASLADGLLVSLVSGVDSIDPTVLLT